MTTTVSKNNNVSKEFKQQVSELLKPIKDKALRISLKNQIIRNVQTGGAELANIEWLKMVVPTYQFKMADYPAESALFAKAYAEQTGGATARVDEFGWHVSAVDRMQWQIFLRGIQIVQAGALAENQNTGA